MILKYISFFIILVIIFIISCSNVIPKNIGIKNGKLAEMPRSPNAVSSQTNITEKHVDPFKFNGNLQNTKKIIIKIIKETSNAKIITQNQNYIHVVYTTKIMKFKDDVEFYFDNKAKLVHFRSASRVGYSDMGLNRKRYNQIKNKYLEQVSEK